MSELEKRGPGRPKKSENKAVVEGRRRKAENIGQARRRLEARPLAGYKTRFTNDVGAKIAIMTLEDDWDFVLKSDYEGIDGAIVGDPGINNTIMPGDKISVPVGKVGERDDVVAYLMKKKEEYFEEDQRKYIEGIARKESLLHHDDDLNSGQLKIN